MNCCVIQRDEQAPRRLITSWTQCITEKPTRTKFKIMNLKNIQINATIFGEIFQGFEKNLSTCVS